MNQKWPLDFFFFPQLQLVAHNVFRLMAGLGSVMNAADSIRKSRKQHNHAIRFNVESRLTNPGYSSLLSRFQYSLLFFKVFSCWYMTGQVCL